KECLNAEIFGSLTEARVVIEQWRCRYNERRPHSSQHYVTPENGGISLTPPPCRCRAESIALPRRQPILVCEKPEHKPA
ncbi:MAG: integrase core domain-containing protein, partial [Sedimenticolaceae bacterium]